MALLGLATGCEPEPQTTPSGQTSSLQGRTFLLRSSAGFQPVLGTTVRLGFSAQEVSFNAGCNSYSGPYQLAGDVLTLSGMGGTEMGCDGPRHQQDSWLATFLTSKPRLTLQGNDLTLQDATATLVFLDREIADPDRPLVGTPWVVDTYLSGGGASGSLMGKQPSFVLGTDGLIQVDTTCNTGSGAFLHDGAQLTLSGMTYTDKPCEGMQAVADQKLRTVLGDGVLSVEIEAARLTLMRGDTGVGASGP